MEDLASLVLFARILIGVPRELQLPQGLLQVVARAGCDLAPYLIDR